MENLEKIFKRIKIAVFENLLTEQFFKVHFMVCNVWYNAWETYLFDTKLWFYHSQVISNWHDLK